MMLLVQTGVPLLDKMRDKSISTTTIDSVATLSEHIQEVASEGEGSRRTVSFDVKRGHLAVHDDQVVWSLETEAKIIEPRSKIELGDLIIASNIDASATEYSNSYIIENAYLQVNISKYGNASSQVTINTTDLVNNIYHKSVGANVSGGFNFYLGDSQNNEGSGYTELLEEGSLLDKAVVIVHLDTPDFYYDLYLILDSSADYLRTQAKNIQRK
ncbi:hypothetical protein GOV04_00030 [Candidatus Woesearchaeota archaeon]|nr:hypothetical protein [Candidatus Woesearchaeota archaeon]